MLGALLPFPDTLQGPPKMLAHVTMDEATRLADAAYAVAVEYDLAKYFSGKTPAFVALIITAGTIYVPKALMLKAMRDHMRKQQQPPNAADVMNQAPAAGVGGAEAGVYKYQA